MPFRIAYVVNEYPKVSHTFIRREILALERQGFEVLRLSLRGWNTPLADDQDLEERPRTRYVLKGGLTALPWAVVRTLLSAPRRFFSALALAIRAGWRAARPLPYHLVYFAEACRLVPWLDAFGARHLHAHFGTNSAEIAMLARALGGPPYSFTVHGSEFEMPRALRLRDKACRAAFVVGVCSHGRAQLYRWLDRGHWSRVHVVHCGLDIAFHDRAPVPPPATPRLVCVGRLCAQKGQLLLIEAVARLVSRGVRIELVLAGDGEMRREIEELVAEHRLQNHVRITGWIGSNQVRDEILAARALILPSFAEGLPVVIMEALALGRPVLTTYVGGIPELVTHGECGWLFPAGSVDHLTAAIDDCLATSPAKLHEMGEAGRRRVLERHAIDTEVAKLACLFRNPSRVSE